MRQATSQTISKQPISIKSHKNSKGGRFLASKSHLLLTTALVGGIGIGITTAFAGDPVAIESDFSVTHNQTENIEATASDVSAVGILSYENIELTNSGTLISLDDSGINLASIGTTTVTNSSLVAGQMSAIIARGNDDVTVNNTGNVGSNVGAVITILSGADAKLDTSGLIEGGNGIAVLSAADENVDGGKVEVKNSGPIFLNDGATYANIETSNFNQESGAIGILAVASNELSYTSGDNNGSQTVFSSNVRATDPDGLDVTIINTGDIADYTVKVDVSTSNSTGIGAGALGDVSITNDGDISTGKNGIMALAGGNIDTENEGDITLTNGGVGISLDTTEVLPDADGGNIKLTNSGKIIATNAEEGIDVESRGTATVTNSGDISASTYVGIEIEAAGAVNLTNSGKIETAGDNADGIATSSDTSDTVVNSGEIIASDAGIRAGGFGFTSVTNQKDGNIHGGNVGISSGGGGASTIVNAGKIEADEYGIKSTAFGGTASFPEDEDDEESILTERSFPGGKVDITNSGTITMVQPDSQQNERWEIDGHSLQSSGNVAVLAVSMNGGSKFENQYDELGNLSEDEFKVTPAADNVANNAVSVTNSGTIDGSNSDQSHGIFAMASDGVNIDNSGDITVDGEAIYVIGNSPITIKNSGAIIVDGESDGTGRDHAIQAVSGDGDNYAKGEAVSVENSGSINLTGAGNNRRAVQARSNGGAVTITNSGSVVTTADGARALHASSGSESFCVFDANDNCTLTPATDGGTVTINSSGSVATAGKDARAVSSWSHGGAINITTSGSLTTKGNNSRAIQAQSGEAGGGDYKIVAKQGSTITINNSAVIGTEGDLSYGINAFSNGGSVDVTNEGKITTAGQYANGFNLKSGNNWLGNGGTASNGGNVSLTNKAGGDIKTSANNARAIQIGSTTGNVTLVNNADLSTVGSSANGVNAYSGGSKKNDSNANFVGGKISITNTGDIATEGATSTALSGWSNGETVAIDNSGDISTEGAESRGIGAYSGVNHTDKDNVIQAGSNLTVANSGSVTTEGKEAYGIDTYTNGGAIKIDLTANSSVSTTGEKSRAISVGSGSSSNLGDVVRAAGGNVIANLNGTLSTTGEGANTVEIWTNGGDVTVKTAAGSTISTDGISSFGVKAHSGETRSVDGYEPHDGGSINITSAATVTTKGDYASAISAFSATDTVTISNTGDLTTSGDFLEGIVASSGAEKDTEEGHVATDGKKVTVTNSGDISMTGSQAMAIVASSENSGVNITNSGALSVGTSATEQKENAGIFVWSSSTATIDNSGAIDVKGDGAFGLFANSTTNTKITNAADIDVDGAFSLAGTSAGSVTINNSGDLTLNRSMDPNNDWNGALMALSNNNVTITNTGDITTSGSGMRAIHSSRAPEGTGGDDTHPNNITIENSGKLSTDGANAHGINVESAGAVTIKNSGDAIVTGNEANGLVSLAETTTKITNSAIISSATGVAIFTGKSVDTIANSGSLIGGASLGDNNDTLSNTGTLVGKFEFGDGNDALHLDAGSIFKDATFDGGDGTDTVYFGGGGTLANTSDNPFNDFEEGTIKAGSWKISGDLQWFETFNAASGSVLDLNGGELNSNKINLLSGSVLKGSGTLIGGVTNNGSILLASTDTLKITGDFYSGKNSKIEFALGGGDGSTHSNLEVTDGKFTFASSDVINIAVDASTDLTEDSRYKLATADGGVDDLSTSNDSTAVKINDSSAAFAFDRTIEDNALWITARATISDAVTQLVPELAEEASAVEEFVVESGSGGALAEQLNGLNDTQLVTAIAELTTPNEAAGTQSLNSTVSTAHNIVDNRIAGRISGSTQRNFYTGDPTDDPNTQNSYRASAGQTEASEVVMAYGGEGIVGSRWLDEGGYTQAWAQAFWGNSTIDSSKSNQYGTSVGLDFRPDQNTLIGGSFSYSRTNADATNSNLEADTFGGMLYGAKGFDSGLAISGVLGYFMSQNESKRLAFGSIYSGDFDSNTFTLSGNISQEINLQQDWLFTPNAGVRYSHATFDDYKETGGVAPLTISRSDVDSVELSAEASFTRNFNITETTKGLFEFHFGGLYEAGDNDSTVAYRFSPTGTMLYSNTEIDRLKFNVGTLVEIPFTDQISSEFAYEGTFADDYADHLLRAKFKVKF